MKLSYPKIYKIFRFLKICNSISCTWPYDPDIGKFEYILREINWSFTILNVIVIQMTLMCTIYEYWHDAMTVMQALTEFACATQLLLNLLICRLKSVRIQHILKEMKEFLLASNDHERIILQKYIDRYTFFSITVVICCLLTVITFCCIPAIISKKYPSEGLYPFPTESPFVISVIYATQVYTTVQCGLCVGVDFMFAIFFMYSAARLEMLCLEIQTAKNKKQINSCIKKHQEIIKFVSETGDIAQFILFVTNIMMAVGAICGTFPIIHRQSLGISFQFIFLVIGECQRLSITAWPADDLRENSERVAMEVYNLSWIGRSQCIIKNVYFMMQRSQRPLVIKMGFLLPALSLKYYAKYLMTILSYFTTMRAIIGNWNH